LTTAGIIGLDYLLPSRTEPLQSSSTSQESTSMISKLTESSSTQLYSLQGRLFFDYNGNGKQETDEPAVQNAAVRAEDANGRISEALTDSSGDYTIEVPAGSYTIYIQPDNTNPNRPKFGYMCRSPSEFRSIQDSYGIIISGSGTFDVGLMEGFLTSPFSENDSYKYISDYVNLDQFPNLRDWTGGAKTYDNHKGTDFIANTGTKIVAAAPGQVFAAWDGWPNNPHWPGKAANGENDYWENGNFVVLSHGYNLWSAYHHLDSITLPGVPWDSYSSGAFVKRGDLIGYSGYSGYEYNLVEIMTPDQAHLHFEITDVTIDQSAFHYRDPFRDLYFGKHGYSRQSSPISFWTVDNDIQCFDEVSIRSFRY